MKYTRYNIKGVKKPKNSNNLIFVIVVGIFLAFLLATVFKKILFGGGLGEKLPTLNIDNLKKEIKLNNRKEKNKEKNTFKELENKDNKNNTNATDTKEESGVLKSDMDLMNFYIVQCGVFKSEDNAKVIMNDIGKKAFPFIVKEKDLHKIVAGVYLEKESENILDELKKNNIESVKIKVQLEKNNENTKQIGKSLDALVKVLNKFNGKNIKSINTEDIKKWTNSLGNGDKEGANFDKLQKIKQHIKQLPKELKRENVEENYKFVYNLLEDICKVK